MLKEVPKQRRKAIPGPPIHSQLLDEEQERPIKLRQHLLRRISATIGSTAVSYFTSFVYPVMIDDWDADMIEDVLQHTDLSRGLCLIINSPGGSAIAAERIVRICRNYSRENFSVLVPRRAKSAATMIALGATKIFMTETSELGPIGTQVVRAGEGGRPQWFSAHALIKSYDDLMQKAEQTQGHVEPYLMQIQSFDAAEIEELRAAEELAKDIALRWLQSRRLKAADKRDVERRMAIFLNPEKTKVHGRGIFYDECKRAGLHVELIETGGKLAELIAELYERTEMLVSGPACAVVESAEYHFAVPASIFGEQAPSAKSE